MKVIEGEAKLWSNMDIKGIFFRTTFDADLAPVEVFGFRGRVEAPCPGREDSTLSLCLGEGCNKFRLKRPTNIGTCEAYVLYYDKSGTFIGAYYREPGARIQRTQSSKQHLQR